MKAETEKDAKNCCETLNFVAKSLAESYGTPGIWNVAKYEEI